MNNSTHAEILCPVCKKPLTWVDDDLPNSVGAFKAICLGEYVYEDGNYMACSYECLERRIKEVDYAE
jgi:hypothetical protein